MAVKVTMCTYLGFDHRHHNTERARIESTLEESEFWGWHAYDGSYTCASYCGYHVVHFGIPDCSMFCI